MHRSRFCFSLVLLVCFALSACVPEEEGQVDVPGVEASDASAKFDMAGVDQVPDMPFVQEDTGPAPDMPPEASDMPLEASDMAMTQEDMKAQVPGARSLATKVDPAFSLEKIKNPKTRQYYKTLIAQLAIDARVTSCQGIPEDQDWSDEHKDWNRSACSNNNYIQGRMLQTHIAELLAIFRLTGDKRLLDEVDRLMELTRSKLGTFKGSERYVQWKPIRLGAVKDDLSKWPQQFLNDILVHALVARVAAALQDNADVPGSAYGEHAKFWRQYLKGKNGYEEKVQQVFHPVFPLIAGNSFGLGQDATSSWKREFGSANLAHIYIHHVLYLHYMGRLTGDPSYAKGAMDMMNAWDRLKVDTVADAYVWPHSTILPDSSPKATGKLAFAPVGYSAMTIRAAVDMALDGQPFFADEQTMSRFAGTVSHHILDQEQFDQGNMANPYRGSIGENRPQWTKGTRCSQTAPTLIRAAPGDRCVDIDGVRFFGRHRDAAVDLAAGAFNIVGAWPHKPSLEALEASKIYAFHAAAYTPKDAFSKGVKSLIFTRLWVEQGRRLKPTRR